MSPLGGRQNSNSLTRRNIYMGCNEELTPENLEQIFKPIEIREFRADGDMMEDEDDFMAHKNKVSSHMKQNNIKKNFFAAIDNVLGGCQSSISDQIAENMTMIENQSRIS